MNTEEKLAKIYERVPSFECKGLCQESCGPIGMSQAEAQVIRERVGARVKIEGDGPQVFLMRFPKLTCPLLNPDGKCSVYANRPAICRIWGAVREMACPHGCRPKKWMTKVESYDVLSATENL